jgi:hypothetical protein
MQRRYPTVLEEEFGNGLDTIFGTEEEQAKKKGLRSIAGDPNKIDELIKKLPDDGVLDVYEKFGKDGRPSFLQVAVEVLKMLKESGIFKEYKLPELGENLSRIGGELDGWDKLYLRYPVQRSVKVWHILRDILIEWDDDLNDPAYVRKLKDGTMNVNDKQHGNFGRLIMGAEQVYVEGITSDDPSMDSNMYASRNIHNLESSWENNANVRVTRARDYEKEDKSVKLDDRPYLDFHNLLDDLDCSWQEAGLPKKPKVCQNGDKLFKDFAAYGPDIFKSCVSMNTSIWPHGELAREFVWGASEFLKQMQPNFTDSQMRDIKSYIKRAVGESYIDNPRKQNRATGEGTLWGDVKAFIGSLENKGENKDWRTSVGANYTIAAGIRDLILNWNAYHKDNSNITYVKLELPMVQYGETDLDIKVGFYPNGHIANAKPYHRDDVIAFNHTELEFDNEDEPETV